MTTSVKITLALSGLAVVGGLCTWWYLSKLPVAESVDKLNKKIVLSYRGKTINVDAKELSDKGMAMVISKTLTVKPAYGNDSDKKTLNGIYITDNNNTVLKSIYFI